MLFKYGRKVSEIIGNYFTNKQRFDNTFKIVVKLTSGYPNYDGCFFTDTDMILMDKTLNLDSEVKIKTINILSIQRKEKLQKIADTQIEIRKYLENNNIIF